MYKIFSKSRKSITFNVVEGDNLKYVQLQYRQVAYSDKMTEQIKNLEKLGLFRVSEVQERD